MSYAPCVGDTGVTGTVTSVIVADGVQLGGIVYADQVQGQANTQYSGPSVQNNPLRFAFSGNYGVTCGQRVSFSVVAGPYAAGAADLVAL
jgi:hypothetical protein